MNIMYVIMIFINWDKLAKWQSVNNATTKYSKEIMKKKIFFISILTLEFFFFFFFFFQLIVHSLLLDTNTNINDGTWNLSFLYLH